ncbi:MAG: M23 family metallopeptidase [Hydrogenibacillus sp.]|nr:M23 family metallopeptidase [Hydrogenibacillus sp.]
MVPTVPLFSNDVPPLDGVGPVVWTLRLTPRYFVPSAASTSAAVSKFDVFGGPAVAVPANHPSPARPDVDFRESGPAGGGEAAAVRTRYRHLAPRFPVPTARPPEPRLLEASSAASASATFSRALGGPYGGTVRATASPSARRPQALSGRPGAARRATDAAFPDAEAEAEAPARVAGPVVFVWPVESPEVTSGFGMRWGRFHYGLDIISRSGERTIVAARSGIVRLSARVSGGYGNLIIIDHDDGLKTYYAHLARRLVAEGEFVRAGTPIGIMGDVGEATGIHLHFEIRRDQQPLNPLSILSDGYVPAP